jgi:hypothetical protein
MKAALRYSSVALTLLLAMPAMARDTRLLLPIDAALKQGRDQGVIGEDVALRFGKGNRGGHGQIIGSDVANRKTNALNKTMSRPATGYS